MNSRNIAVKTLDRIINEGAYSNIILSNELNKSDLSDVDKALVTEIVYGTFDRNSCRPKGYTQSLIKEINNADLWLSADEAIEHRFSDIKMSRGKALLSLNDI